MVDGHRVAVYYQTQYDHSLPPDTQWGHYVSVLPLIGVITHLLVAAFHINNVRTPYPTIALNDNDPDDDYYKRMWNEITTLQSNGIQIIGMVGGAAAGSYQALDEDFEFYYGKLAHYVSKYKLDGLDLDVEEWTSIDLIIKLIDRLKADFGDGFIITLAPVASALLENGNLSGFDYIELEARRGDKISWYNAQFYSGFGSLFPDDQYINITHYGRGLDASKLVATTLTNAESGGGWIDPDSIVQSVKNLTILYGDHFGGVAGWEYFNSIPAPNQPWQWATLMWNSMLNPQRNLKKQINSRITGNRRRL